MPGQEDRHENDALFAILPRVGVRAALHFGDGDMGFNVVLVFVNVIGGAVLKREREMASVTLDLSL